jgi:hypothetical protein
MPTLRMDQDVKLYYDSARHGAPTISMSGGDAKACCPSLAGRGPG